MPLTPRTCSVFFLPARSASASSKSASTPEPTKAPAPAAAPSASAKTPAPSTAAAPTKSARWDDERQTPRTRAASTATRAAEKEENDKEDDEDRKRRNSAFPARRIFDLRFAELWRCECRVEREFEFLGEPFRRAERYELESGAIVFRYECGGSFSADIADVRIGEKSLRAVTRRNEAVSAAVTARLPGNHQDDGSGVAGRISGITNLPDLPLPSDLQGDFLYVAGADVGERDDRHLSVRTSCAIRSIRWAASA